MWHLYNGCWRDDLISPTEMMWFWCHIPKTIKTLRMFKCKKRTKVLAVLYTIGCMILEPVQFVVYYGLIPLQAVSEWFCNIGKD